MNLVIVESPAKAKTIEKYLGKDYKVLASFGHVRDLPKGSLGVDVDKNYQPKYVISTKAKKTVSQLKAEADKAQHLYLATDLDREGEAISWHLLSALKWNKPYDRITFSEITKSALIHAISNPRQINSNLVDAQQARRVLDRLVGYKLSPLLWKKISGGLSAGRVQSVAVRLIVEREREIRNFKPEEFWQIAVELSKIDDEKKFRASLLKIDGKTLGKLEIKTAEQADEVRKSLTGAQYVVDSVESRESIRRPSAPFTTSTLQMEASRKLGYSAKQTMMLAQRLYEDGKITYMRTDSTNLSADAVTAIRKQVSAEYGDNYLPTGAQVFQTKTQRAQEAHEAIRPTNVEEKVATSDSQQQKLYELIWKRAVASQMQNAIFDVVEVYVSAETDKKYIFLAKGETLKFDGFMRVYMEGKDDEVLEDEYDIPVVDKGEQLKFWQLFTSQKFTEPPKRYSEATLVKKLESLGIGRPSTYAPTLATIQDRGYVILQDKRFVPEEIGEMVNDLLVNNFPNIVDYKFTAKMEEEFDDIADGKSKWQQIIDAFYVPFAKELAEKEGAINKSEVIGGGEVDEKCPECGKNLTLRMGRYGKFLACSGYPECRFSKPLGDDKNEEKVVSEEKCPECGGALNLKQSRFGKFWACENYPKCKYTQNINKPTGVKCPDCKDGDVVQRRTKRGRIFWGCSKYPKCKYASWDDPNKDDKNKE